MKINEKEENECISKIKVLFVQQRSLMTHTSFQRFIMTTKTTMTKRKMKSKGRKIINVLLKGIFL